MENRRCNKHTLEENNKEYVVNASPGYIKRVFCHENNPVEIAAKAVNNLAKSRGTTPDEILSEAYCGLVEISECVEGALVMEVSAADVLDFINKPKYLQGDGVPYLTVHVREQDLERLEQISAEIEQARAEHHQAFLHKFTREGTQQLVSEAIKMATGIREGSTQDLIAKKCDQVKDLLLRKNEDYGNSALDPVRIFSKADAEEQIRVRIDDKLSRLAGEGEKNFSEDTVMDLVGYLILLMVKMEEGK